MEVRPNRMILADRQIYNHTILSLKFLVALLPIEIKFRSFVLPSLSSAKLHYSVRIGHWQSYKLSSTSLLRFLIDLNPQFPVPCSVGLCILFA